MLLCVVLAVVVSVGVAQKKFCCTPDQWEGYIEDVTEHSGALLNGTISWSYDYTNKMTAATFLITAGGVTQKLKEITNYKKKLLYKIQGSQCDTTPFPTDMMKMCVPDNAVSTGKVYYGQAGTMLMADTYRVPQGANGTMYVTVTTDTCLPITNFKVVTGEYAGFENRAFVNITTGIKDPSVFTPPASCNSTETVGHRDVPVIDHHLKKYMHKMRTLL